MSTEPKDTVMNVESLQMKLENQQNIIKQLSNENEELYQQFNHLMIRNNKLLKRIDDLQGIIDDLHIRIEELQLINGNILKLNDKIRKGNDARTVENDVVSTSTDTSGKANDDLKSSLEFNSVFSYWKNFPGQDAKNQPNLLKQAQMLTHLYHHKALRASDLFTLTGVGGVTGARYVATLKKFGMINYTGARKKGQYEMTPKGADFIEHALKEPLTLESGSFRISSKFPVIEQEGIPVKEDVKEQLSTQIDHPDL